MNTPLLSDLEVRPGPVLLYVYTAVDMHVRAPASSWLCSAAAAATAEAVGQGANQLGLRRVYWINKRLTPIKNEPRQIYWTKNEMIQTQPTKTEY